VTANKLAQIGLLHDKHFALQYRYVIGLSEASMLYKNGHTFQ